MNRAGNENRSVRNTKKKLRDGLLRLMQEKPVNEITVKELTELADINRGTFYTHYSDVYDMLRALEDEFFAELDRILEAERPTAETTYLYLLAIFSFLGENQDFCRTLLGPNGDLQFVRRVIGLVGKKCSAIWRQGAPNTEEKRFELYNAFIITGSVGLIQSWLDDGLQESAEEVSRVAGTIILASIAPCIHGAGI
jgi:AcrR family transcriptional regulator